VKVLYLNHTAEVSGGERSLLTLLAADSDQLEMRLAAPRGRLGEEVAALGIPVETIPGTAGSLRLHPLHTPRAMLEMAAAGRATQKIARANGSELLHANSIRAGLILGAARTARPSVVHVRDVLPPGAASTATMRMIAATATVIVANSDYTAQSVLELAPRAVIEVVPNPVDLTRWDPARVDRVHARASLRGVRPRALLLGVVAQLTPWKGQDTAIEVLHLLRGKGVDAHLLLIGSAKFTAASTRFDNRAYVERLKSRVAELRLEDRVSWLGEREDVPELISALDVLLLPSREEPFGRVLIEAMAMRVPVIATNVGGPSEIVIDGVGGFLVDPADHDAWARAVKYFADHPQLGREMGLAGRHRVEREFGSERHLEAILDVYEQAFDRVRGWSG
jgi:glycosyltransferase involved in cell wall biosynthesis